ncbi:hypothetical protein AYI68_g2456 [Smittium mucronatum]|uniref:Uncharacterized protein n=1 Tax=Smittium mucronatum TaxID=133383 RepID=A0A1R0H2L9_9FUNG|nr:hypothetical protein AYI68_g2456 [Smittium mucronatum]
MLQSIQSSSEQSPSSFLWRSAKRTPNRCLTSSTKLNGVADVEPLPRFGALSKNDQNHLANEFTEPESLYRKTNDSSLSGIYGYKKVGENIKYNHSSDRNNHLSRLSSSEFRESAVTEKRIDNGGFKRVMIHEDGARNSQILSSDLSPKKKHKSTPYPNRSMRKI